MANSLVSNVRAKLLRKFAAQMEWNAVYLKAVDRQLLVGKYDNTAGTYVDLKRPHLATVSRTSDGDLTSETNKYVTSGYIRGEMQNVATVHSELTLDEITHSGDQMDEILRQRAVALNIEIEKDIQNFIIQNGAVCFGTPGTAADAHKDVAGAVATVQELGCPSDSLYYGMGPYQAAELADAQSGIYSETKVKTAWEDAMVSRNLGGAIALKTRVPVSYTTLAETDRAGSLNATPTITYLGAKDSMTQTLSITGLGSSSAALKAGDVLKFDDVYWVNPRTGNKLVDGAGNEVNYTATVTDDVTLSGGASAAVTATAGIYESGGAYNNTSSPGLASGDTFTVLGTNGTSYRPNLIFSKYAVAIGFAKIPKFKGQESYTISTNGLMVTVSEGTDIVTGKTVTRFDCQYALAMCNPMWAGKAFGV